MKHTRNLKEINMDECFFGNLFTRQGEAEKMSDLNNHPTIFIFYHVVAWFWKVYRFGTANTVEV